MDNIVVGSRELRMFGKFRNPACSVRIGCALILVILILELLFGPLSIMVNAFRINRIRAELPAARARWQSHGISDYDIDVRASIPPACWFEATLSVRGGELNAVMAREGPHLLEVAGLFFYAESTRTFTNEVRPWVMLTTRLLHHTRTA